MKRIILNRDNGESFSYEFDKFDARVFLILTSALDKATSCDKVTLEISTVDGPSCTYLASYASDRVGPSDFGTLYYLKTYTFEGLNTVIDTMVGELSYAYSMPNTILSSNFIYRLRQLGIELTLVSEEKDTNNTKEDNDSYKEFCKNMDKYIKDHNLI